MTIFSIKNLFAFYPRSITLDDKTIKIDAPKDTVIEYERNNKNVVVKINSKKDQGVGNNVDLIQNESASKKNNSIDKKA